MGRFVDVLSAPVVGSWGWQVKPNLCYADPVTATYFGMTPQEGRKGQAIQRFLRAIHPDDQERVEFAVARSVHEGTPYRETYRVITLDGETRTIMASGFCFRDQDGNPDLYPGHFVDIGPAAAVEDIAYELGGAITLARQMADASDMSMLRYLLDMARLEFWDVYAARTKSAGHPH